MGRVESAPHCVVEAFPIDQECRVAMEHHANNPALGILTVLQAERDCSRYLAWKPGRGPREHETMIENQLLRESLERREAVDRAWREQQETLRKQHDIELKADERKWQEEQKNDERKWQEQQKENDRQWQERQEQGRRRFQAILAVGAALAGLLGALVGAAIKSSR